MLKYWKTLEILQTVPVRTEANEHGLADRPTRYNTEIAYKYECDESEEYRKSDGLDDRQCSRGKKFENLKESFLWFTF